MLCSSKSSCYLCHLFITTHRQFHVPSTNGTIYDRWMLSESQWSSSDMLTIISRLNVIIEKRIRFFLKQGKLIFTQPNESVLRTYTPWSSFTTLSRNSLQPKVIKSHLSQQRSFLQGPEIASSTGVAPIFPHSQQGDAAERNPEELRRSTEALEISRDEFVTASTYIEEPRISQERGSSAYSVDERVLSEQQQDLARALSHTSKSTSDSQRTLRPARASSSSLHLDRIQTPADRTNNCTPDGSMGIVEDKHFASVALTRDTWNYFKLLPPDYSIRLPTDSVYLQLFEERDINMKDAVETEPSRDCWVGVKWVRLIDNNPNLPHKTRQLVDLELLGSDDEVVETGPYAQAKSLWLRRRNDLLAIIFAFGSPSSAPNSSDYEHDLRLQY